MTGVLKIKVAGEWVELPTASVLPPGGTTGQALVKASDDDYDVEWGEAGIDPGLLGVPLMANDAVTEAVTYTTQTTTDTVTTALT